MAGKKTQKGQLEVPDTQSPGRIQELHVLGLELYDLQNRRMELTKQEKAKRGEAGAALHSRGLTEYAADGVELWLEGSEKVKVRMDADDDEEPAEE